MRLFETIHLCASLSLALAVTLAGLAEPSVARADDKPLKAGTLSTMELNARIQELIQQLGASKYSTRQAAKKELKRLRLDAFDALNEACDHDDIEISLSARYLVRSMQVNWWTDDDPPEVKRLLTEYGTQSESDRQSLTEQLARLGREASFAPLCRLIRYEASDRLSKIAALQTLSLDPPTEEAELKRYADEMLVRVGKSNRVASDWLRAYASLLVDDPAAHDRWVALIQKEQVVLTEAPDETNRDVTRDLVKWYADQLLQRSQRNESMAMTRRMIELLDAKEHELVEAADWMRERNMWETIVELADRYPDTVQRNALLQYRLALAYRSLKRHDLANETAQLALKAIDPEPADHLEMAANLQHDGLFEWSELEYRHVMSLLEEEPGEALRAQLFLAEMLHDLGREQAAGKVLTGLLELVESDAKVLDSLGSELGREVSSIQSRKYYFFAQYHGKRKEYAKQRELLLEGISHDPHDADVLIAMYRVVEADGAWREATTKRIEEAARFFRDQIKETAQRLEAARSFDDRTVAQYQLALSNNQLAWLVANTEGDFDESLRCSLRSLELQRERAGFLDTLGRCYYAKGDYKRAVASQTRAVALEPHSPLILDQLKLFQDALRKKQAAEAQEAQQKTPQ